MGEPITGQVAGGGSVVQPVMAVAIRMFVRGVPKIRHRSAFSQAMADVLLHGKSYEASARARGVTKSTLVRAVGRFNAGLMDAMAAEGLGAGELVRRK